MNGNENWGLFEKAEAAGGFESIGDDSLRYFDRSAFSDSKFSNRDLFRRNPRVVFFTSKQEITNDALLVVLKLSVEPQNDEYSSKVFFFVACVKRNKTSVGRSREML